MAILGKCGHLPYDSKDTAFLGRCGYRPYDSKVVAILGNQLKDLVLHPAPPPLNHYLPHYNSTSQSLQLNSLATHSPNSLATLSIQSLKLNSLVIHSLQPQQSI